MRVFIFFSPPCMIPGKKELSINIFKKSRLQLRNTEKQFEELKTHTFVIARKSIK